MITAAALRSMRQSAEQRKSHKRVSNEVVAQSIAQHCNLRDDAYDLRGFCVCLFRAVNVSCATTCDYVVEVILYIF